MSTRIHSRGSRGNAVSRYERQARARSRRVQKRLERARQERASRARRGRGRGPRLQNARAQLWLGLLFGGPLLVGVALTPALAMGAVEWWRGEAPRLASISVIGHQRLAAREVALATGLAKAERLDALQLEEAAERLARHPWIRTVRMALLPTGTLIVDIEERQARAVVRGADGETGHFLDENCVPFAPAPASLPGDSPLPMLRSATTPETGLADGELCRALALAESLRGLGGPDASPRHRHYARSEVVLPDPGSDLGWTLQAPSGAAVILGAGSGELVSGRLANLERLLDSGVDVLERASTIDLRFAGQAVLRDLAAPDGAPKGGG